MRIAIFGLSISSSWGNGHATTYRALVKALSRRGHDVTFFERDVPWYAANRDLPEPEFCDLVLYDSIDRVVTEFRAALRQSDVVIIGSYVPQGIELVRRLLRTAGGACCFYDIDTPVTLAMLDEGRCEYLSENLIPRFDVYFSFTGGATLNRLERAYGSPRAVALYCAVDPDLHSPMDIEPHWDLGYLGTYSADRQPLLEQLLLEPARQLPTRRFVVAGPQYPEDIDWPANVERIEHLPPSDHRRFYCRQRFTLNLTRADMKRAGYAPSVRLFEAAACGTAIISDQWPGLDELFAPDRDILPAGSTHEVVEYLSRLNESQRLSIGRAGRRRVMRLHTADHRAVEFEEALRPPPGTSDSTTLVAGSNHNE